MERQIQIIEPHLLTATPVKHQGTDMRGFMFIVAMLISPIAAWTMFMFWIVEAETSYSFGLYFWLLGDVTLPAQTSVVIFPTFLLVFLMSLFGIACFACGAYLMSGIICYTEAHS